MTLLVLKAWALLFICDVAMHVCRFKTFYEYIRHAPVRCLGSESKQSQEQLCRAIDLACVFYFKKAYCLQCSAAATLLLRKYGWSAQMVVAAKIRPFKYHAWVEVDGVIVNDRPYLNEIYHVLERC